MKLFRRVPPNFFTPEREDELTEFAEKAQLFAAEQEGDRVNYLVDMFSDNEVMWDVFLQESWVIKHNPLTDSRGNLDMLAAFIAEGGNHLRDTWDNVCWARYSDFQNDLARSGLHGLHFRIGINDAMDRVEHTKTLAFMLFKLNPTSFMNNLNALQGLSSLVECRELAEGYLTNIRLSKAVSMEDVKLLIAGAQGANPDDYRLALTKMLYGNNTPVEKVRTHLIFDIENALVPLVYNYGYLLKSKGVSVEEIKDKASANIDALLAFLTLETPAQAAIKRQILINLFSPFPEGLEMMNATTEEIQGAFLDPALVGHPCTEAFGFTLCGPVAVFGAEASTRKADRRTQIVEYFKETPYALDFEVAIRGRMAKSEIIVDLFADKYSNGHSTFMDEILCGQRPQVFIPEDLLGHLLHRDRICRYSDQAVLELVTRTLSHIRAPGVLGRKFLAEGSRGLDLTFKDRPHLRDAVLQMLDENKLLTKDMFDWFGFGARELKVLGRRASNDLKQHVLQGALGL